jgi:fluoroacetyl-CoA thioesterase
MKRTLSTHTLKPGITYEHRYTVSDQQLVPALYPEAEEFQLMPEVFATGFMVGFLEWACLKAVMPYINWPLEQTVGTHVNVSHESATPAGMEVIARVELIEVDGRRLKFKVEGYDESGLISRGTHERTIIDKQRFDETLVEKRNKVRETKS